MSWSATITPGYVRQLVGISDSSFDGALQLYINSLIQAIEYDTDLDFNADIAATISETFKFTTKRNIFVLDGEILQSSAWQEITTVEISEVQPTPVWKTLIIDQDLSLINFETSPNPIFQLKFLCSKIRPNQQIKITGKKGFSSDSSIPPQILMFIATATSAYYGYLSSGGLADGTSLVESERSLTRSVSFSAKAFETWRGPKLFAPNQIQEFEKLLKTFNLRPFYPY